MFEKSLIQREAGQVATAVDTLDVIFCLNWSKFSICSSSRLSNSCSIVVARRWLNCALLISSWPSLMSPWPRLIRSWPRLIFSWPSSNEAFASSCCFSSSKRRWDLFDWSFWSCALSLVVSLPISWTTVCWDERQES